MITHPPCVYSLNFKSEIIEGIKQDYFDAFNLRTRDLNEKCYGHTAKGIADIIQRRAPMLTDYTLDSGLVMILNPGTETNIHVDYRTDRTIDRNITINFPIINTESITSFYKDPDQRFAYDISTSYTTGIYFKSEVPVASFTMEDQAVLFNTSIFHKVSNLSKTDTRILLSCSFKVQYSFNECLDILKSLGYAE